MNEIKEVIDVTKRYDFILLFDVKDGNPNGDPDAGNLPRIDAETGEGLVTDVCIKRKIRNYVQIAVDLGVKETNKDTDRIFIKEKAILNKLISEGYDEGNKESSKDESNGIKINNARKWMCDHYYDIRTFGAVMSTGDNKTKNAGQVRGAVQLTFARSVDPIFYADHCITRCAVTKEADEDKERTMGRKATVPYGLYKMYGFVTPHYAKDTGFSEDDLELFWTALQNMFDVDHSAARGLMSPRGLIVFKHSSELGNAPAYELFDRVKISRKDPSTPARSFEDYAVVIDDEDLPTGTEIKELI